MKKSNTINVALINPSYNDEKLIFYSIPYLVNGLRKQNPTVDFKVFDCPSYQYNLETLFSKLKEYQPDIVGVSVPFTITLENALRIIDECKKLFPIAWIISGGVHASICPEDLVKVCDYVVMGDGERPMYHIIQSFKSKSKQQDIPGTAFFEKGKMKVIPKEQIDNLSMGSPDWSTLDLNPFLFPVVFGSQKKGFSVFTSKRCPYNCSYCSNHLLWNKKIVYRDLKEVFSEIEMLMNKYHINQFLLQNDLFTMNRERVLEFCEIIEERNLDIEWFFQTRANLVTQKNKDMFFKMKKTGAIVASIGIESGNDKILRINKSISTNQVVNAIKILKSVGFMIYAGFIIGFPEDTIDTVWETITYPNELDIDSPGFQLMVPYPKTRVREKALKEGGILTNDFSKYTTYGVVYVPPGLNEYDLLAIRKFAYQYFHTRSRKRVDNFLKRFEGMKDYKSIKKKYNLIYDQKDNYNKEYMMSLKYHKDNSKNKKKVERLPI